MGTAFRSRRASLVGYESPKHLISGQNNKERQRGNVPKSQKEGQQEQGRNQSPPPTQRAGLYTDNHNLSRHCPVLCGDRGSWKLRPLLCPQLISAQTQNSNPRISRLPLNYTVQNESNTLILEAEEAKQPHCFISESSLKLSDFLKVNAKGPTLLSLGDCSYPSPTHMGSW